MCYFIRTVQENVWRRSHSAGFLFCRLRRYPAMAAETLTVQEQGFYRSDGTKLEGAVAKGVTFPNIRIRREPLTGMP